MLIWMCALSFNNIIWEQNITSSLISPSDQLGLQTIEDLKISNMTIYLHDMFRTWIPEMYGLSNQYAFNNISQHFYALGNGSRLGAYIIPDYFLETIHGIHNTLYRDQVYSVIKEPVGTGVCGYALRKNSPFTGVFENVSMLLEEFGLIKGEFIFKRHSLRHLGWQPQNQRNLIEMADFEMYFYALGYAFIVGTLIFVSEILFYTLKQRST